MVKSDMAKERPWGGNTAKPIICENWGIQHRHPKGPQKNPTAGCLDDSPLETGDVFYLSNPTIREDGEKKPHAMAAMVLIIFTNQLDPIGLILPTIFSQFPRLGLPAVPQRGAGWESCTNRQTLRLPWTDSPGVHGAVGIFKHGPQPFRGFSLGIPKTMGINTRMI